MENYEVISQLGKGNFGVISKIKRKQDGRILVWKEMDYGKMSEKEKSQIVAEVNILRELKHPNIVRYYDRIIDKKNTKIFIIMEYCEGGDIGQLIKKCKKNKELIAEDVIWKIFTQIILALFECHQPNKDGKKILHRDLKPNNIFLDSENNVKLGDFGLARVLSNESCFADSHVGTPYYMSPEQIEEKEYNEKSDIWSLGCFLYELTTFNPPFEAKNHYSLALKIKSGKVERISSRYSDELQRVILWLMQTDLNKRPSIEDLLNLPQVSLRLREKRLKENLLKLKKYEESINIKEEELKKKEKLLEEREDNITKKESSLNEREINLTKQLFYLKEMEEKINSSSKKSNLNFELKDNVIDDRNATLKNLNTQYNDNRNSGMYFKNDQTYFENKDIYEDLELNSNDEYEFMNDNNKALYDRKRSGSNSPTFSKVNINKSFNCFYNPNINNSNINSSLENRNTNNHQFAINQINAGIGHDKNSIVNKSMSIHNNIEKFEKVNHNNYSSIDEVNHMNENYIPDRKNIRNTIMNNKPYDDIRKSDKTSHSNTKIKIIKEDFSERVDRVKTPVGITRSINNINNQLDNNKDKDKEKNSNQNQIFSIQQNQIKYISTENSFKGNFINDEFRGDKKNDKTIKIDSFKNNINSKNIKILNNNGGKSSSKNKTNVNMLLNTYKSNQINLNQNNNIDENEGNSFQNKNQSRFSDIGFNDNINTIKNKNPDLMNFSTELKEDESNEIYKSGNTNNLHNYFNITPKSMTNQSLDIKYNINSNVSDNKTINKSNNIIKQIVSQVSNGHNIIPIRNSGQYNSDSLKMQNKSKTKIKNNSNSNNSNANSGASLNNNNSIIKNSNGIKQGISRVSNNKNQSISGLKNENNSQSNLNAVINTDRSYFQTETNLNNFVNTNQKVNNAKNSERSNIESYSSNMYVNTHQTQHDNNNSLQIKLNKNNSNFISTVSEKTFKHGLYNDNRNTERDRSISPETNYIKTVTYTDNNRTSNNKKIFK